jgi:lysophospholipase L1-like esterase
LATILACIIFASTSCVKTQMENPTPLPIDTTALATGKTYLALGDSYTIGQNVGAEERFPAQTVAILKASGISLNTPRYIATTGWTTNNLINAINAENVKGPFDIVSLLIGVNDQYQRLDTAGYRVRFTQLLNKSIELAGNRISRVFVVSIPDYSATPFVHPGDKQRVTREIDQFNAINKEVTLKNKITYIDITPGSRDAATNPSLVANDGLHPSGLEYRKWAEKLAVEVAKVLK